MPHCAGFTYSALPTELSCLPSSPYLKGTSQFLTTEEREREREGGETFSKLSGNATHAFPASLVKRPTARKPINSQRFELRGTCFLQKLIRERMMGGVRGGGGVGGGGVSFTTIHIHHALASFLTMKEVQNKQHKNKQTNKQTAPNGL